MKSSLASTKQYVGENVEVLNFIYAFAFNYFVAYLFLPSRFDVSELPITRGGYNNDILHYIDYSAYLQRLGFQNIAGSDYLLEPYWVTPSVHYFFDLVAFGFGGDVMSATMPLLYATIAIIACAISMTARKVFHIPFGVSLLIGTITISGSFFQYVYGNGFFPQFISSVVLLLGLLQISHYLDQDRKKWRDLFGIVFIYDFILFYTYPALLIIFLLCQALLVFFAEIVFQDPVKKSTLMERLIGKLPKILFWWGGATAAAWVALAAFDWGHMRDVSTGYLANLSTANVGWPLDFLPIYSLLGLPGPMQPGFLKAALSFGCGFLLFGLMAKEYILARTADVTALQRSFLLTGLVAYLAYVFYFAEVGSSYQQWKLAAYLPLLWSWVWLSVIVRKFVAGRNLSGSAARTGGEFADPSGVLELENAKAEKRKRDASLFFKLKQLPRKDLVAMFSAIVIVLVNLAQHRIATDHVDRFDKRYSNLSAIDGIEGFGELYIHMNSYATTFLAPYFIRTKFLHLLSESYYAKQEYDPAKISPTSPLFLDGTDCYGPGAVPIKDMGCLFTAPPSIKFDQVYGFSAGGRDHLVMTMSEFTEPESWGMWAVGSKANLVLSMNVEGLNVHPEGYLNLELRLLLPAGRRAQRIAFHLPGGVFEDVSVGEREWVSLPYERANWQGAPVASLALTVDLLDSSDLDPTGKDTRKTSMGFVSLSLSQNPKGRPLSLH
jgi:hypothetical protein